MNMQTAIVAPAGASHALAIGTKKKPASIDISRAGAALAAGKVGTIARAAERASLPEQAMRGGYWAFSGYILASFPAVAKQFAAAQERQREIVKLLDNTVELTDAQAAKLKVATSGANCRIGFAMLVQLTMDHAATASKISKAQQECLAQIRAFVALSAAATEGTPAA